MAESVNFEINANVNGHENIDKLVDAMEQLQAASSAVQEALRSSVSGEAGYFDDMADATQAAAEAAETAREAWGDAAVQLEELLKLGAETTLEEFMQGVIENGPEIEEILKESGVSMEELAEAMRNVDFATHDWREELGELAGPLDEIMQKVAGIDLEKFSANMAEIPLQASEWTNQFKEMIGPLDDVTKRLTGFSAAQVTGAGIIAGTILKFKEWTQEVIALGDQFVDLAKRRDISTNFIQELKFVSDQTGISFGALTNAVADMNRRLGGDVEKVSASLAKMGLSLKDLEGLNTEEKFKLIVDSLKNIEDPAVRASTAMALLGRTGKDLANLGGEVDALTQRFKDLGLAVDKDVLEAGDKLSDNMKTLDSVFTKMKSEAIGPLVVGLAGLSEAFLSFLEDSKPFAEEAEKWTDAVRKFLDSLNVPILNDWIGDAEKFLAVLTLIVNKGNELRDFVSPMSMKETLPEGPNAPDLSAEDIKARDANLSKSYLEAQARGAAHQQFIENATSEHTLRMIEIDQKAADARAKIQEEFNKKALDEAKKAAEEQAKLAQMLSEARFEAGESGMAALQAHIAQGADAAERQALQVAAGIDARAAAEERYAVVLQENYDELKEKLKELAESYEEVGSSADAATSQGLFDLEGIDELDEVRDRLQEVNEELEEQEEKKKRLADAQAALSESLQRGADITGILDALGLMDTQLGQIIGSIVQADAAGKQMKLSFEQFRSAGDWFGGLISGIQGVIQGIQAIDKATEGGGIAGVAGGAAAGAQMGTAILPGWGTAIGAAAGAIVGWVKSNSRNWNTVMEEAGRDMGVSLSEGLAQQIHESGENVQLFLSDIFAEGNLGIDRYAEEVGDLFSMFERGEIDEGTLTAELKEDLPILIENFEELGEAGQEQVERILASAEDLGLEFEELSELIVMAMDPEVFEAVINQFGVTQAAADELGITYEDLKAKAEDMFAPETMESIMESFDLTAEQVRELGDALGKPIQTELERMAANVGLTVENYNALAEAAERAYGIKPEQLESFLAALGVSATELATALGVDVSASVGTVATETDEANQNINNAADAANRLGDNLAAAADAASRIRIPDFGGLPEIPTTGAQHGFHGDVVGPRMFYVEPGVNERVDIGKPGKGGGGGGNQTFNINITMPQGTTKEQIHAFADAVERDSFGINKRLQKSLSR